jgi:outer membrane protein OmpA-like peptidoglycan-associated protein
MSKLITTVLITLLAGQALAQQSTDTQQIVPLFRVTVVGRTTPAINYRPGSDTTKVDLVGTALMPEARGVAEVSGNKGAYEIDARVERMQPATQFGPEYLTYVIWAITPEGRAKNLGEIQIDDEKARIETATELQAFAMIVTAEPYFAVTQPSDVVVMENAVREGTEGDVQTVQARYELLKRGSYLMERATHFERKPLEPGAPLDLAQARNAVALARLAGAEQHASQTFSQATRLLADAELAREKGRRGNEVTMPARQAAQTAEDARLITMQRQEAEAAAAQQAAAAARERVVDQRERNAIERTEAADERRRQAELEVQAAASEKSAAERERIEAERTRQESSKEQAEAEQVRLDAQRAQAAAEAEAQQSRLQAVRAQAAAAVAEQERNELRRQLREQLNMILETRESARGLIMMVPDVLFRTASATLTAEAREKLARVGGILASHSDLRVSAEGHTDNVGDAQTNQQLSERRAAAVLAYLAQQKVPLTAVDTAGFGESRPIASNDTAEGRRQNRRVELIVSGESIGRAAGAGNAGQ